MIVSAPDAIISPAHREYRPPSPIAFCVRISIKGFLGNDMPGIGTYLQWYGYF